MGGGGGGGSDQFFPMLSMGVGRNFQVMSSSKKCSHPPPRTKSPSIDRIKASIRRNKVLNMEKMVPIKGENRPATWRKTFVFIFQ